MASAGPLTYAATETLNRDYIWRHQPPLHPDCDHTLRARPIAEFRQTVTCTTCGGLAAQLSQDLTANPTAYRVTEDGRITENPR